MLYQLDDLRVQLRGSGHFVADSAALIGNVILEERASVWFNAVLRGDNEPITIGPGSNGIAPMPVRTGTGRTILQPRRVEIDETTLKKIAARTGGKYFNSRDVDALAATYREIDQLERSEITEMRYLQYEEHYRFFLLAALGLVALASGLSGTTFRRLP